MPLPRAVAGAWARHLAAVCPTLRMSAPSLPAHFPFLWAHAVFPFFSSEMLLILGDSFAYHFRDHFRHAQGVRAVGLRGARIGNPEFRRWAIRRAVIERPPKEERFRVLLIVGGNDIARSAFRQRDLQADFAELVAGLLAAGAETVFILPLPPRDAARPGDARLTQYRRRRRLANYVLLRTYRGEPAVCLAFRPPAGFLGRDGVHPSARGWQALCELASSLLA